MAFALRITATTKNGQEISIEPSWWNENELRSTYDFKEELDYYLDCYLFVNKQTFQEIVESQEKYKNKPLYQDEYWKEENSQATSELAHLIQNLEKESTVEIWIYEWE